LNKNLKESILQRNFRQLDGVVAAAVATVFAEVKIYNFFLIKLIFLNINFINIVTTST